MIKRINAHALFTLTAIVFMLTACSFPQGPRIADQLMTEESQTAQPRLLEQLHRHANP
jgi:hypothetical protein